MEFQAKAKQSYSILVLDDDPMDIKFLRLQLNRIPRFQPVIHEATTLDEVLAVLDQNHIDVILVDFELGEITGDEVLVKVLEAGHSLPMLVITGHADESFVQEAFQAGAADYLIKGEMTPEEMGRAIGYAIEMSHLQQTLGRKTIVLEETSQILKKKHLEIQSFYHILSHELKAPLSAVQEFLTLCLDGTAGDLSSQQKEYLSVAADGCDLMGNHINEMLDVTKLETGKLTLSLKLTELAEVVAAAVNGFGARAEEKGIDLVLESQPDLLPIRIDRNWINKVMVNLLDNAWKFTPKGGRITVRVFADETDVDFQKVSVTDTGSGISKENQKKVFERLFQDRAREEGDQGGLGLGLSLCQGLVILHGGEMELVSVAGEGSTFTVSLPVPEVVPAVC